MDALILDAGSEQSSAKNYYEGNSKQSRKSRTGRVKVAHTQVTLADPKQRTPAGPKQRNFNMPLLRLDPLLQEPATKAQSTPQDIANMRNEFARVGQSGPEELRLLPLTARASTQTSGKKLIPNLQSAQTVKRDGIDNKVTARSSISAAN